MLIPVLAVLAANYLDGVNGGSSFSNSQRLSDSASHSLIKVIRQLNAE
jgi:hypothetical protein